MVEDQNALAAPIGPYLETGTVAGEWIGALHPGPVGRQLRRFGDVVAVIEYDLEVPASGQRRLLGGFGPIREVGPDVAVPDTLQVGLCVTFCIATVGLVQRLGVESGTVLARVPVLDDVALVVET